MSPGSPRKLIPVVLLLALAVIVAPPRAQAAPAWLSPIDLSARDQPVHGARVAVDAQGNAIAVWESGPTGDVVQTASRRAGGDWSDAQDIAPGENPQLAVSPQGSAVAIWDAGNVVQAATRPAGASPSEPRGGWSEPHGLSPAGQGVEDVLGPQVAIDAQGAAVAVWVQRSGCEVECVLMIRAAIRPAGASPSGGWSDSHDVSAPGQDITDNSPAIPDAQAQVALDAQGNAVAVWKLHDGTRFVVQAATRPAGASPSAERGGWSTPQELAGPGGEGSYIHPQLAVGPEGNAVAAWQRIKDADSLQTTYLVQAATRPAGASPSAPRGGWSEPQDLPVGAEDAIGAQVAVDGRGNAVAIWLNSLVAPGGITSARPVQAATRPAEASPSAPRGGWSAPQNVSPVNQSANDAELAAGPSGDLAVVWRRYEGAGTEWSGANDIVAAIRPVGGDWGGPHDLDTFLPPIVPAPPQVAVDAQGNAVAMWSALGGLGTSSPPVRAAGYDGAGPQLRDLRVPEVGTAGAPLAFSVSPVDVWSDVASTKWDFGDGTSQPALSPSHTYTAPGTYQVTVTSTDDTPAPANSSTATRTVTIAGPTTGGWDTGMVPGGTAGTGTTTGTTLPSTGTLSGGGATTSAMRLALRRCLSRANRLSTRARRRAARIRCTRAGRPGGPSASAVSASEIILSFRAPGSVGRGGPPARRYVIKQSTRPIRSERDFGGALRLCGRTCAFTPRTRGQRLSLRITQLRSKRTYYYSIKAVGAGRRTGPRSDTARARTR